MGIETELKLHIAPEYLAKLKRHPLIRAHTTGRASTQELYSIYYDTPDLELHRSRMALRLRKVGPQWLQTLKGGGQVSAGLHQRNEWEVPVPSERLDFAALAAAGGDLPKGVRNRLQPVFITAFTRNSRMLRYEGALIELCMDSGEIRSGSSRCPISELELELKAGEPQVLFRLGLALLDVVPVQVEHTSKAEYGHLLFSAARPAASKAKFPSLNKAQGTGSVLRDLIATCLAHVQANVPRALLKVDAEYLHQVRVGLRRLRVILTAAQRYRADAETPALRAAVAGLCKELGRSRDWDVFVTQTLAPLCARLPEHAGLREVLAESEQERSRQHAGMEDSLASRDFQQLLLRFGVWFNDAGWDQDLQPLESFARKRIQKYHRKVLALGQGIMPGDAERLHELRIVCKKLRYSIEMFGSLFGKTAGFVESLSELQDILGALNDIAVAHRLLDRLDNAARRDTLLLIRDWMQHDQAARIADFDKAWRRFAQRRGDWDATAQA
jgi:inorganic triphosphatase YgiF